MTAKEAIRKQKADSPRVSRWLKWARLRYLPARGKLDLRVGKARKGDAR